MTIIYSLVIFTAIQIGRFFLRKVKELASISTILHPLSIIWALLPWLPIRFEPIGYFIAFILSALFILRLLNRLLSIKFALPSLPVNLLEIVLIIVIFLVMLNAVLHVKLSGLIVSSAVLTAIVGFALQDILSSLFYGIVFSIERPFKIGEWVSIANQTGKIFKINWRAVYIKTLDNRTVIVPNSIVAKQEIINYSYPDPLLRRSIRVGVAYGTDPDLVKEALLEAARDVQRVLKTPAPDIDLVEFGDHAIIYELRFWIDRYEEHLEVEDAVGSKIWYTFQRKGIEIPFPIRTVYLKEAASTKEINKEEFIRGIEIFNALSEEEIKYIARRARFEHYAAGETVVHQGDEGDSLYVITCGEAEVLHIGDGDTEQHITILRNGSVFGEMSLLTGARRSATVRAKTPLDLILIDKKTFREILLKNPSLTESLSKLLVERQRDLEAKRKPLTREEEAKARKNLFDRIRYFFGL
ncbi:MAG: cyclic nucleotide-binding domain-containing protein [candidate division WOR-3 bacterium]